MTPRQLLFKKFPQINTQSLLLRKLEHSDSEKLNELLNNVEIQKHQTANYYSREDIWNYIESQSETFKSLFKFMLK